MQGWRAVTGRGKHARAVIWRVQSITRARCLARAYFTWRGVGERKRAMEEMSWAAGGYWRRRQLYCTWDALKAYAVKGGKTRAACAHAIRRMRRTVLAAWARRAAVFRSARRQAAGRRDKVAQAVLRGWAGVAGTGRERASRFQFALRRNRHRVLAAALSAWRRQAADLPGPQQFGRLASSWTAVDGRLGARVLRLWHGSVLARGRADAVVRGALMRHSCRVLFMVFHALHGEVLHAGWAVEGAERALAVRRRKLAAGVFSAWAALAWDVQRPRQLAGGMG